MRFTSDPRVYVLAAAVIDADAVEDVRDVMESLRTTGRKLHWRDLAPRQRDQVIEAVAGLDAMHMVTIAAPFDPRRQERARAKCVERLLAHLGALGVGHLVLEQRTASLNEHDRRLIARLRGSKAFPSALTVDLGLPSGEPLLWLPDVVAGAIGDELADATTPWAKQLTSCVERLEVDLNMR